MKDTEAVRVDFFGLPSIPATLRVDECVGKPSEVLVITIDVDDSIAVSDLLIELVDEEGEIVRSLPAHAPTVSLQIPSSVAPGDYVIRLKSNDWILDSVPFEITDHETADLTRSLLRASVLQADALVAFELPELDTVAVFDKALEAEGLYLRTDGPRLAISTWRRVASAFAERGMAAEAQQAAQRLVRLRANPGLQNLRSGAELDVISNEYMPVLLGVRPDPWISDQALLTRVRDLLRHFEFRDTQRVQLLAAQQLLLTLRVPEDASSDIKARGSLPWAVHRFSSDVLPGLLTDLAIHRTGGLARSTTSAIEQALVQSSNALVAIEKNERSSVHVQVLLLHFSKGLGDWSVVQGHEPAAQAQRDQIWSGLRRLRARLARHISKVKWSTVIDSNKSGAPSAVVLISPFVEIAAKEASLMQTAVAVSRIVRKVEVAANDTSSNE